MILAALGLCLLPQVRTEPLPAAFKVAEGPLSLSVVAHEWTAFDTALTRQHSANIGYYVIGYNLLASPVDLLNGGGIFRVDPLRWFAIGHRFPPEPGLGATSEIHRFGGGGFVTHQWQRCWSDNQSVYERTVYSTLNLPRYLPWGVPIYVQCFTVDRRNGHHRASTVWRFVNHGIAPK